VALPSAGGGGGAPLTRPPDEFTDQITGRDGVLASAAPVGARQLGLDDQVSAAPTAAMPSSSTWLQRIGFGLAAFGGAGVDGKRPCLRRPLAAPVRTWSSCG